jgi:hypothetical protein
MRDIDIDRTIWTCPYRDRKEDTTGRSDICKTKKEPCIALIDRGECGALKKLFERESKYG